MATETTLKTVERALQVLEIVAGADAPPLIREVSGRLGHNITSTYHLVNTLIGSGYLDKRENGRLAIGRKASLLHASYLRTSDFSETARPLVSALAEDSGETVYLTRFSDDASVIEVVVESTRSVRVAGLRVGFSGFEDRRASGKAVLALLPPERLDSVFTRLHPELSERERAARLARLSHEFGAIRSQGYALDDEEYEEGVCCVAAPYFDSAGRAVGAIAASCPAQRAEHLRDTVLPQILATARQLTEVRA